METEPKGGFVVDHLVGLNRPAEEHRCDSCEKIKTGCTIIWAGWYKGLRQVTLCPECFEYLILSDPPLMERWYRALYRLHPTNWTSCLTEHERFLLNTARAFTRCTEKADVSQDGRMMHLIDKLASMLDEGLIKPSTELIRTLLNALPDSVHEDDESWEWAWEEMRDGAQDKVKAARRVAEKFLKEK